MKTHQFLLDSVGRFNSWCRYLHLSRSLDMRGIEILNFRSSGIRVSKVNFFSCCFWMLWLILRSDRLFRTIMIWIPIDANILHLTFLEQHFELFHVWVRMIYSCLLLRNLIFILHHSIVFVHLISVNILSYSGNFFSFKWGCKWAIGFKSFDFLPMPFFDS